MTLLLSGEIDLVLWLACIKDDDDARILPQVDFFPLTKTVLTGGWEAKYKHVIHRKRKIKPTISKLRRYDTATSLDVEQGSEDFHGDESTIKPFIPKTVAVTPEDLPQHMIDAARGFFSHARYWMEGKEGIPPAALVELMEQTVDVDGIECLKDKGGLTGRMMSADRQRMLFLISFAR